MKPNHETIYLAPTDYDGGQLTYSWCDCPTPDEGMDPADAIKYVRADLVPASNEVLARRVVELSETVTAISNQLAAKPSDSGYEKLQAERDALAAQVEQLRGFALHVNSSCANYIMDGKRIDFEKLGCYASDVYKATPAQCLAEVKAQAVDEHTKLLVESTMAVPVPAENEQANTRMRDVLVNVINHANWLRQQAKAGA